MDIVFTHLLLIMIQPNYGSQYTVIEKCAMQKMYATMFAW